MDSLEQSGARILSFIERVEQIEIEMADLRDAKKNILDEAKGEGYDVKILREILKLRKQKADERDQHETMLERYLRALQAAQN